MAKSKAKAAVQEEAVPKTTITVELFTPVNSLPVTHRPRITFCGEMVSRRALEDIHFHMIKAARSYRVTQVKALDAERKEAESTNGETDEKEIGDE